MLEIVTICEILKRDKIMNREQILFKIERI